MGGQRLYVYEEGHGLEGRQSAFVTTPFWQHPDQAIMAERGPSRGSKTGRWNLCVHTRYVGTSSTILVPWVNANIKAATAAIIGQGSGQCWGRGEGPGQREEKASKGQYGSQTANPVKPWPAGPPPLSRGAASGQMWFVSTGHTNTTKTKERPITNRLALAAVAYRERWHRDEQVHEVPRPWPLPHPHAKQRHTWMSENTAHMVAFVAPASHPVQPQETGSQATLHRSRSVIIMVKRRDRLCSQLNRGGGLSERSGRTVSTRK